MSVLKGLNPERVFYYFEEICNIPHGSGNTKEISDYLVSFAKKHGLEYIQDDINNVIIYQKGSAGYEDSEVVILQGHMDMVCEKAPGSDFDFQKDGLNLEIEGDFVHAKDTTLGGDDGIAVAYALAILEDETICHPPLEVVITVDEEIGLIGAGDLDYSKLTGKTMINLDSEEDGIFFISCAGGMTSTSHVPVRYREAEGTSVFVKIQGLMGGHSGAEIHKNGANAHILMGRLLLALKDQISYQLVAMHGGGKETAITQECDVTLLVEPEDVPVVLELLTKAQDGFRKEYQGIEKDLTITSQVGSQTKAQVLHPTDLEKIIFYLNHVPNSVLKMSGTIEGLVESSNNMGVLLLNEEEFVASSAPRSSVESARDYIASKIQYLTEFLGGEYDESGVYPAWEYRDNSHLQEVMTDVYEKMFEKKPSIQALHAGLECGLFYNAIEDLDCVSMGPDILDIHTFKERISISSVEKNYKYLLEVLKTLK